jgi:outer membrane protein assembly factor BamB
VVLGFAAVTAIGIGRGWFDSTDVEGSTEGFEATAEPRPGAVGEWTEFGYDSQRSRSNTDLRIPPPYAAAWRVDAGSLLEFPPVIRDGRVIVGTNRGRMFAVEAGTGRILWNRKLRGRVAAAPAVTARVAIIPTTQGYVYGVNPATGGVRWRVKVGGAVESSPLLADSSAYVGTLDGRIFKLNVRDGSQVWNAKGGGDVKGSLAVAGSLVIASDYGGRVTAFRRSDGRQVWQTESPGTTLRGAGRFYAGPAVAYGRVFIGNVNGRVMALDQHTGAIAWVRVLDDFVYSSAAVSRRTVYVGSYDTRLYALDAVTGRVRWSFNARERISGSPTVIGGLVYFSTIARRPKDGRTFALDARTGRLQWNFSDGRYGGAVGVKGLLVVTGVRTLYGLVPR